MPAQSVVAASARPPVVWGRGCCRLAHTRGSTHCFRSFANPVPQAQAQAQAQAEAGQETGQASKRRQGQTRRLTRRRPVGEGLVACRMVEEGEHLLHRSDVSAPYMRAHTHALRYAPGRWCCTLSTYLRVAAMNQSPPLQTDGCPEAAAGARCQVGRG